MATGKDLIYSVSWVSILFELYIGDVIGLERADTMISMRMRIAYTDGLLFYRVPLQKSQHSTRLIMTIHHGAGIDHMHDPMANNHLRLHPA